MARLEDDTRAGTNIVRHLSRVTPTDSRVATLKRTMKTTLDLLDLRGITLVRRRASTLTLASDARALALARRSLSTVAPTNTQPALAVIRRHNSTVIATDLRSVTLVRRRASTLTTKAAYRIRFLDVDEEEVISNAEDLMVWFMLWASQPYGIHLQRIIDAAKGSTISGGDP